MGSTRAGVGSAIDTAGLIAAGVSLRWVRPDLTAALADHVLEMASADDDRERWLEAAGWAVHARSAIGDGRVVAIDVLAGLSRWGAAPLAAPAASRLCVELAQLATSAGARHLARALLATGTVTDAPAELQADTYCALAGCATDPVVVTESLRRAEAAWSEIEGPRADLGSGAVALAAAAAQRRAGRVALAVDRAAEGLARLDRRWGASSFGGPAGHLAAALAAEWISGLLDAGRPGAARDGCGPLDVRLRAKARPSRQIGRLRLVVVRARASEADGQDAGEELEKAARDAVGSDAPGLESACRSALAALHEAKGRLEAARGSRCLGVAAQQRDNDRGDRFLAGVQAIALDAADERPTVASFVRSDATAAWSAPPPRPGRNVGIGRRHRRNGLGADATAGGDRSDPWSLGSTDDLDLADRGVPSTGQDAVGVRDAGDRDGGGWDGGGWDGGGWDGGGWDVAAVRDSGGGSDPGGGREVTAGPDSAGWAARGLDTDRSDPGGGEPMTGDHAVVDGGVDVEASRPPTAGHRQEAGTADPAPRLAGPAAGGATEDPLSRSLWQAMGGDSPIGDMLARTILSGGYAAEEGRDSVAAVSGEAAHRRHRRAAEPAAPTPDGAESSDRPAAEGRGEVPTAPDGGRHGEGDEPVSAPPAAAGPGEADPRSWLLSALAELDRVGLAGDPPEPTRFVDPAAAGCVVVVDVARDGRRFAGPRARAVVRGVAERLADRLPAGARIRHDDVDACSVVLAGWDRSAATHWMHSTLPALLEGFVAAVDRPGTQLRAAVHDADGLVGAQLLQRLDLGPATRPDHRTAPAGDDPSAAAPAEVAATDPATTTEEGGRHKANGGAPFRLDGEQVTAGSGGRRHRRDADRPATPPPAAARSPAPTSTEGPNTEGPSTEGPNTEGLGLADLLAGALAAYRGI